MKQLPDIVTSTNFWASIGTLWAASGAWFTYVAAAISSRQQTYDGILSLIKGLEAELKLVSEWASGEEASKGYTAKAQAQLVLEHPDWFNPSRMVFTFSTPVLNSVTTSPYARSLNPIVQPLVMLNHSIRRLFDTIERYQAFAMGDHVMYGNVMKKFAPKRSLTELGSAPPPMTIVVPHPSQIQWTADEQTYINNIFLMNMGIHQGLIGGVDSGDSVCLFKAFRIAREAVQDFKKELKREPLPKWFFLLHIVAGALASIGVWQVMRWFGIIPLLR